MVDSLASVTPLHAVGFVYDDGGRAAAGFRGHTGDCAVRAIAIATGIPYRDVYDGLWKVNRRRKRDPLRSPRLGVWKEAERAYLTPLGWRWTPTMSIGSGTTVHLRADELPAGRVICQTSKHLVAVIDGVIHDLADPSRDGTRCVYGYWQPPEEGQS